MKHFIAPLILATMITGAASTCGGSNGAPLENTDATKAAFGFEVISGMVSEPSSDPPYRTSNCALMQVGDPACTDLELIDGYRIGAGEVQCVDSSSCNGVYDTVYKKALDGQMGQDVWNGMYASYPVSLNKGGICICSSPDGSTDGCNPNALWKITFATKIVNCALGPVVTAANCTDTCGTVTQKIATAASGGGTECAIQEIYDCQPGDGACPRNCVLGPSVKATDCTAACGTLTQQITTEASGGGAACATQETYVCQVGDGSCIEASSATITRPAAAAGAATAALLLVLSANI